MKTTGQLSQVIDRVNAVWFWGETFSKVQRTALARAIAVTHAKDGAYADSFALSEKERKDGVLLFTGERATSASARHISAEEACRALRLLNASDRSVKQALNAATEGLQQCLHRSERATDHRMGGNPGIFCCGRCSVSVWRHILAGGFDRRDERLRGGLQRLKDCRDGRGRWAAFPFWYTVAALCEFEMPQVQDEIHYAAPLLQRAAKRNDAKNEYDRRRSEIARRALAKI